MMQDRLQGIFPPLPTIFNPATGDVDPEAMTDNVRRLMTTGLAGALVLGSNGEAGSLDDDEADRVVASVREAVPASKLMLVGTGRESTRATIAASRRAAAQGADAVLVRTPSYFKSQMTHEAVVTHYRAVADASPVPVLVYNLPGVTGVTLTVAIVSALVEHPNIVGLKETSPELDRLGQFVTLRGGNFAVFSGWAPVVYPAIASGACGGILAVANVAPQACVTLFEHARAGRHAEALAAQRRLTHLAQLVSTTYGVAGLKLALDLLGYHGGPVRGPLLAASSQAKDEIARALAALRS